MFRKAEMFPEYKQTGISRTKLLEMMNESHSLGLTIERGHLPTPDLIYMYISSLDKVENYINDTTYKNNVCAQEHTIKVNILSNRQIYLSDIIFEYIVDYSHIYLPRIYHEIYDYISDYNSPRDDFNYAELLLLQKMVKLLLKMAKEYN